MHGGTFKVGVVLNQLVLAELKRNTVMQNKSIDKGCGRVSNQFLVANLFACLILPLMGTGPARAAGAQDCLPGEPGCIEVPEPHAEWYGPASTLKYRLNNRANLWTSAWRSQDNESKPWPKDTYDPEYVNPTHFTATFRDQCQTELDFQYYNNDDQSVPLNNLSTYRWSVDGAVQVAEGSCAIQPLQFAGQGVHDVKLEVFHPGASTPFETRQRTVRVRDYLVVLFGDSASSGEGSPESPRTGENEYGIWIDRRCHRSTKAGVPQAIQKIEEDDPYTSITFLNFACSGATISLPEEGKGAGIIAPYAGIEPPPDATPDENPVDFSLYFLPSQIDQLANALYCRNGTTGGSVGNSGCSSPQPLLARSVDKMFMTGGINDVQFAVLMLACTLEDDCNNQISPFYNNTEDGDHLKVDLELESFAAEIPDRYVDFKEVMDWKGLNVDKTYVLEYPNAFTDENGSVCEEIAEDVLPPSSLAALLYNPVVGPLLPTVFSLVPYLAQELAIDATDVYSVLGNALGGDLSVRDEEVQWMNDFGTPTLNGAVATGVEDVNLDYPGANFNYVGGISAKFFKHGYCSSNNWIRRATQSSFRQGPWNFVSRPLNLPVPPPLFVAPPYGLGIEAETKGLMHPTDEGYAAIAEVLQPIMNQLWNLAPETSSDFYQIDNGVKLITGPFDGPLVNDKDPNGDELRAVLIAGEGQMHGTATLSFQGQLTYTPDPNFKDGLDFVYYYVTDGALKSSKTKITVQVGELKFLPPATPNRWEWNYPEGEDAPTVEIGGVVEFPVCNFCGDRVVRTNPELPPVYGEVTFLKVEDRWNGRYVQNGETPALLPYLDSISVQIGRAYRSVFQMEGEAAIDVYVKGDRPADWSWIFRDPEFVSQSAPTTFDVCDNCADLVVRVNVPPEYGRVTLEPDAGRGRWVATYEYTTGGTSIPTSDVFSVEIGEENATGEFRSLGVARISVSFSGDI